MSRAELTVDESEENEALGDMRGVEVCQRVLRALSDACAEQVAGTHEGETADADAREAEHDRLQRRPCTRRMSRASVRAQKAQRLPIGPPAFPACASAPDTGCNARAQAHRQW